MPLIYHLISPADWKKALDKGVYAPASLQAEGFIHFSTRGQLLPTAKRFYQAEKELVVLEVSVKQVQESLKWEAAENEELFPHVYARLPIEKVSDTRMLWKDGRGEWQWD